MTLNPEPGNAITHAADSLARAYQSDLRQPALIRERILRQVVDLGLASGRAIDVGCGDGSTTASLAAVVPERPVLGVDISAAMIDAATANFGDLADFEVGTFEQMPVEPSSAALITALNMWHLVVDREGALREASRVLKSGGLLAIVGALREDLAIQTIHRLFPAFHRISYGRHQSRAQLTAMAELNGLRPILFETVDFEVPLGLPSQVVELVAEKPFFDMRLMTDADFDAGFDAFRHDLSELPEDEAVTTPSRCSVVVFSVGEA
ncbi:MAG: Methyltransferase type 11 [Glaciihabitans sp.]|jgi:SAM-dependent methyltransferase|nr:Methyltransferase type 11 [Glaciihabitans sp.]